MVLAIEMQPRKNETSPPCFRSNLCVAAVAGETETEEAKPKSEKCTRAIDPRRKEGPLNIDWSTPLLVT